ncbi:hypothetical protein AB6802_20520 [Mesorhizobium sp. RCC_202]|uniref:hypothetical protein n=1 Tax=Mesorhizobium sp. RCC_202 TaxID=3239222 RepID=UPI003523560E
MANGAKSSLRAFTISWFLAILVILLWLLLLLLMWFRVEAQKETWDHMVTVMTALQALAFAAAGALWGVKVQEIETDKAKDDKAKAVDVARKGKTLAEMIDGHLAKQRGGDLNIVGDDLGGLRHQAQIVRDAVLPD